jgi:hypothetical protein
MTAPAVVALAEHAAEIRRLGRLTVENVVEIGRRLAECRLLLKEDGNWRSWLDCELKLSPQSAGRFIQVYEQRSKLEHLNLPVSALYLLAAPSTPKEAVDKVVKRAQAGEPVSAAKVKRIINGCKSRARSSSKTGKSKQPQADEAAKAATSKPKLIDFDVPLKPAHDRIARKLLKQFDEAPGEVQHHFVRYFQGFLPVDIDQRSADEIARQDAEIGKLRKDLCAAERKITELESEIADLKVATQIREATPPPDDGLDVPKILLRQPKEMVS